MLQLGVRQFGVLQLGVLQLGVLQLGVLQFGVLQLLAESASAFSCTHNFSAPLGMHFTHPLLGLRPMEPPDAIALAPSP